MVASLSVLLLCASGSVSTNMLQGIIVTAIILSMYMQRSSPEQYAPRLEKFESPGADRPPHTSLLNHYLDVHDEAEKMYSNGGASDVSFTRVEKVIQGPGSNDCGVFGDFVLFCTVSGAHGDGNVVDIRAIDSDDTLTNVGLDFLTSDGMAYVRGNVGDVTVVVKRPDGVDTLSYLLIRTAQDVALKIVTPSQDDGIIADTKACSVVLRPLVNQEMALNRGGAPLGKVVNFGVYNASLSTPQVTEVESFLRRVMLMRNPIVRDMNSAMTEAQRALETAKTQNPFGSKRVGEKCATSIPDWTKPDYTAASRDCRSEITSHCTIHPGSAGCECWDKSSPAYETSACQSYRNLFSGNAAVDLTNLDPASLDVVKSKYGLSSAPPAAVETSTRGRSKEQQDRKWFDYVLGTKN